MEKCIRMRIDLKGLLPGVPGHAKRPVFACFQAKSVSVLVQTDSRVRGASGSVDGHWEWEVEAIVGHRQLRHGLKYCVKWKDTPQEQWLPATALRHCRRLVTDYHRSQNLPLPTGSFNDRADDRGAAGISPKDQILDV